MPHGKKKVWREMQGSKRTQATKAGRKYAHLYGTFTEQTYHPSLWGLGPKTRNTQTPVFGSGRQ